MKGEAKALREVLQQQQQMHGHSQQDSGAAQEISSLRGQLADAERRSREAEEMVAQLPDIDRRRREAEEKLQALERQLVRQLPCPVCMQHHFTYPPY